MSWRVRDLSAIEMVLIVAASAALLVWYAVPQLWFSLYGTYQLALLLFPRLPGG